MFDKDQLYYLGKVSQLVDRIEMHEFAIRMDTGYTIIYNHLNFNSIGRSKFKFGSFTTKGSFDSKTKLIMESLKYGLSVLLEQYPNTLPVTGVTGVKNNSFLSRIQRRTHSMQLS